MKLDDKFWALIAKTDSCWLWQGYTNKKGYGSVRRRHIRAMPIPVHRYAYEQLVGKIPEGLYLDHLCRIPSCVNPEHLEPVTNKENVLRGVGISAKNAKKTHCLRGHEFTSENTYRWSGKPNGRSCKKCLNLRVAEQRLRERTTKMGLEIKSE